MYTQFSGQRAGNDPVLHTLKRMGIIFEGETSRSIKVEQTKTPIKRGVKKRMRKSSLIQTGTPATASQ